jgi:hypothetical protein
MIKPSFDVEHKQNSYACCILDPMERDTLNAWTQARNLPYRKVFRVRIILMAMEVVLNRDIVKASGILNPTVQLWRERFIALHLAGLKKNVSHPSLKPKILEKNTQAIIAATLHTQPLHTTHRSTRSMTRTQGLGQSMVWGIWDHDLPKFFHLKTFKLSQDKWLMDKFVYVWALSEYSR